MKSLHVLKNVIHVLLLSAGFNKLNFTCHKYFLVFTQSKIYFQYGLMFELTFKLL